MQYAAQITVGKVKTDIHRFDLRGVFEAIADEFGISEPVDSDECLTIIHLRLSRGIDLEIRALLNGIDLRLDLDEAHSAIASNHALLAYEGEIHSRTSP